MLVLEYLHKALTFRQRVRRRIYHLRKTKPAVVNWRGIKIALGDHIPANVIDALLSEAYEKGEASIVKKYIRPEDVVLEVGTGLGAIALLCSRKIGADRVHTYEANPSLEQYVTNNFRLNGLHPHYQICLLAEGPGEADFFVTPSFEKSSAVQAVEGSSITKTPTKSLNQELQRVQPTFLIVDIEGGEYEFFQTLTDFGRINKVAIELHEHIIGAEKISIIKRRLVDAGFTIDPKETVGMQLFAYKKAKSG